MTTQKMTRRKFLKAAALTVGASTLVCTGIGFAATRTPAIDYPEFALGEENSMNQRVLVVYASRAGSTAEVAAAIAETIAARGYAVDVKPIKDNPSVDGYQAVLVGSAVRFGAWLPVAVKFVEANRLALSQVSTSFFAVHLNNRGDDEVSRAARHAYLDAARQLVAPKAEAFFAGVGDPAKMSLLEGLISKAVNSPEGDFRDWTAIRGWAKDIAL